MSFRLRKKGVAKMAEGTFSLQLIRRAAFFQSCNSSKKAAGNNFNIEAARHEIFLTHCVLGSYFQLYPDISSNYLLGQI